VPLSGEKEEYLGVKSGPGGREGWGEGGLRFRFDFSLLYSDMIGNNFFPQAKPVLPMMVISE